MSWKLDSIDFLTYGVYVSKVEGLFNMPKIKNDSHDWLDEDGEDFWHDIADQKYDKRKINIYCLILNDTYLGFISQLKAFYDALTVANKRLLTTPYLSSDIECYLEDNISIDRKSRYVGTKQIGVFVLTLTIPGDPDYSLINISRTYSYNVVAVAKTKDCKIIKDLQGDSSLTLSFESNTKLDIAKDDFIQYEYKGLGQDRFILNTVPNFEKQSTNKYVYSLKFDHQVTLLSRTQFLNDLGESDFSYYGNIEGVIDLIISNHGRSGYNKFYKGTIVSTLNKNHKFSSESCFEVLKRLCVEYELEYEFEKRDPDWWNYNINIKTQVANDKAVTLQYGKGNGQYKLNRSAMIESDYFTRLYAFGAAKNLPVGYRSGLSRLSFDANPLEQNLDAINFREKTIYFDDIFPSRTGTVTSYTQVLEGSLTPAQKESWPNGMYKMIDTAMDFDLNSYLLGGQTAKIVMKTGVLAGYEFDISKYDATNKEFYLTPFNDSGYIVPNATLMIAAGDTYTIINIDLPASYVTAAENALQAAAVDALAEGSTPKYEYTSIIDPKFVFDNSLFLEVGDRVTLIDTDYSINGTFRISRLTYNDYSGEYELTFSEKRKLSRLQVIEKVVQEQQRTAEETGTNTVESMRDSQQTAGEVKRILLDPTDEKLNVDNIVRNNSLDPGMLSIDVEPNFYLKNALVELNYGGNEDAVRIEPGEIVITNWAPLSRFAIAKLKDTGGTYNPTRSWVIPQTDITLPTKDAYVLYLKLNLATGSTACTVEAHTEHVEGKLDIYDGYLYKRFYPISAGEEV